MTRQPAQLRLLNAPADAAEIARLDLSLEAHRVFVLQRREMGFDLVEKVSPPPIEGQYEVGWATLADSAYAVVAEQAGRVVDVAALDVSEWNRRGTVTQL